VALAARSVERIPYMMGILERKEREQATGEKPATESGQARPPGTPSAVPAVPPQTVLRLDTSSPQASMNLFLTSMAVGDLTLATSCLDLSGLREADRELGRMLAGKLWLVLNRHALIVVQDLPADPDGRRT